MKYSKYATTSYLFQNRFVSVTIQIFMSSKMLNIRRFEILSETILIVWLKFKAGPIHTISWQTSVNIGRIACLKISFWYRF